MLHVAYTVAPEPTGFAFTFSTLRPPTVAADGAEHTRADELMVVSAIYDHRARVRSYELLAEVARPLSPPDPVAAPAGGG